MPTGVYPRISLAVRFWSHVTKSAGCWEWQAARRFGYGVAWDGRRLVVAHRLAWQLERGPIPEGMTLDHLCRNRACVRPDHLEPVSLADNIRRGRPFRGPTALKAECYRGHSFTAENTYLRPDGYRACRACHRIAQGRRKERAA